MIQTKYKAAAIQMVCELGNKGANIAKALSMIDEAIRQQAKLIVLPELFSTGYKVEKRDLQLSEEIPGETIDKLLKVANLERIYIAGAILEAGETLGVVYDTAFLVGPDGLIGKYRKIYLWDKENIRFARGKEYPVFHTPLGNIGLQICYEIGFPEGARFLTLKGANILLYPSAFGAPRKYVWEIAGRSRALENGCYVIASNRSGREQEIEFCGNSRIISPKGEVMVNAVDLDEVIICEIDLSMVKVQRNTIPYLRDLKQNLNLT